DLLIMGTHGRKGLDKLIFGSVAEKVTKTTPIPMMLINPYKTKN
ncbi:MAG: universal stress protein, partial [Desulfobacterium sp.]|nr:universal stress protein [Desulfobacterium sp.]MBU4037489.1 universal stress protein [Pseudomonadota bacterium]